MNAHDHSQCCGPESAYAARQYLLSNGEHSQRAYQWRLQMRNHGYVILWGMHGSLPLDHARNDATLAEARDTSFWLRWDGS